MEETQASCLYVCPDCLIVLIPGAGQEPPTECATCGTPLVKCDPVEVDEDSEVSA